MSNTVLQFVNTSSQVPPQHPDQGCNHGKCGRPAPIDDSVDWLRHPTERRWVGEWIARAETLRPHVAWCFATFRGICRIHFHAREAVMRAWRTDWCDATLGHPPANRLLVDTQFVCQFTGCQNVVDLHSKAWQPPRFEFDDAST